MYILLIVCRVAEKDLDLGGFYIPKGTALMLNVMTAHALELAPQGWKPDASEIASGKVPAHMELANIKDSFQPER